MVSEPRPVTGDGGRRGRLRQAGVVAIPPVALVAVIGAALLGAAVPQPAPLPTPVPRIAVDASPATAVPSPAAPIEFPTEALGLRVVDVATALDRSGNPTDTVLAVRGYLQMLSPSPCGPVTPFDETWAAFAAEQGFVSSTDTFCERHATLRPQAVTDPSRPTPRLNVTITIGAVVPNLPPIPPGGVVPVVAIGALASNADACAFINGCERRFAVDRLVWVNGLFHGPTTSVEPSMNGEGPLLASRTRDALASTVIARSDAQLLETLVQAATLAEVDPMAASSLALANGAAGRVWYRRVLDTTSGRAAGIRWVALDDATGTVLGHGSVSP